VGLSRVLVNAIASNSHCFAVATPTVPTLRMVAIASTVIGFMVYLLSFPLNFSHRWSRDPDGAEC
jgi:hypothetical protein